MKADITDPLSKDSDCIVYMYVYIHVSSSIVESICGKNNKLIDTRCNVYVDVDYYRAYACVCVDNAAVTSVYRSVFAINMIYYPVVIPDNGN